jgi:hypothetical protein
MIWLVISIVFSVLAGVRAKRWTKEEKNSVFDAYAGKNLQNMNLPEFRFITHETTVQEVIAKLGLPSRRRKLSLDSVVEKQTVGAYHLNGMSISVLEYDLPYRAVVMVMPEYPGNPNDKIRAVFYRGAQADEDAPRAQAEEDCSPFLNGDSRPSRPELILHKVSRQPFKPL